MTQIDSKVDSKSTPPSAGPSNRLFIMAVAAIVVIGLAVIAIIATSSNDDSASSTDAASADADNTDGDGADDAQSPASDGAETATVELSGEPLAPLPEGVRIGDAATDPEFGSVAPTMVGTGFDGGSVRIEPDGRAKAIYFVAHWCPHCQEEIPVVQDLVDEGTVPDGLDVYAVSTGVNDGAGNFPPSEWLVEEGFTPTVVRDDEASTAFQSYGGAGFPYVVYLDAQHQVVARSSGNLDGSTTAQLWELAASAQ